MEFFSHLARMVASRRVSIPSFSGRKEMRPLPSVWRWELSSLLFLKVIVLQRRGHGEFTRFTTTWICFEPLNIAFEICCGSFKDIVSVRSEKAASSSSKPAAKATKAPARVTRRSDEIRRRLVAGVEVRGWFLFRKNVCV